MQKQIYQWMHEKLAEGFDEMTNLSGVLAGKVKGADLHLHLLRAGGGADFQD